MRSLCPAVCVFARRLPLLSFYSCGAGAHWGRQYHCACCRCVSCHGAIFITVAPNIAAIVLGDGIECGGGGEGEGRNFPWTILTVQRVSQERKEVVAYAALLSVGAEQHLAVQQQRSSSSSSCFGWEEGGREE